MRLHLVHRFCPPIGLFVFCPLPRSRPHPILCPNRSSHLAWDKSTAKFARRPSHRRPPPSSHMRMKLISKAKPRLRLGGVEHFHAFVSDHIDSMFTSEVWAHLRRSAKKWDMNAMWRKWSKTVEMRLEDGFNAYAALISYKPTHVLPSPTPDSSSGASASVPCAPPSPPTLRRSHSSSMVMVGDISTKFP